MITYNRSAFGLNLVFRIHGSAVYRSVVPSLLAVGVFFIIRNLLRPAGYIDFGENLGHPYAIGVLVASTTFLIVFRANQGYSRYWEAASATHHMMSKWMDATTHSCVYHLQCDHYKDIKPPSYFDYEALNHLNLTRHRERNLEDMKQDEDDADDSENSNHQEEQLILRTSATHQTYPGTTATTATVGSPTSARMAGGATSARTSTYASGTSRRKQLKRERTVRSVVKSINKVENIKKFESLKTTPRRAKSMDDASSIRPMDAAASLASYFELLKVQQQKKSSHRKPFPLLGKPRLDGNWGAYFGPKSEPGSATFFDCKNPDFIDPMGFAGIQGGHTPPLFLQELAHLSSLLVAVALSTLRNDIEGAESPLAVYEPGKPWPEVDPDKDEWLKLDSGLQVFVRNFGQFLRDFLGMGRGAAEQTRYNAARPLPVIGGVSDAEIRFLQMARGPYAKTQLCWNWLSEFCIREHLAGSMGKVGPPIISRIIQFLGDGMIFYNHARKVMFIPFPFPHAQLSVLFILVMVPCIPFLMDQYTSDPWLGASLTFFTVLCLSGIHEVARELENPFRNVPNELPLVTLQAQYNEALITMYSGYHPDHFWDGEKILRKRASEQQQQQTAAAVPMPPPPPPPPQSEPKRATSEPPPPIPPPEKFNGEEEEIITFSSGESDDNTTNAQEIAALKRQLAEQAKLIEQLAAKISSTADTTSPEQAVKKVTFIADQAIENMSANTNNGI